MKVSYIAHPISDAVIVRCEQVKAIQWEILQNEAGVYPYAPYLRSLELLSDEIPEQRKIGMTFNRMVLESGLVDELRLYGDVLSKGMIEELNICLIEGIDIVAMNDYMAKAAGAWIRAQGIPDCA
jgi:hypothetical protein